VTWAAVRPAQRAEAAGRGSGVVALPAWRELVRAVAAIRPLQEADGAIPAAHHAEATALVAEITAALERLAPALPHQTDHLAATVVDFGTGSSGLLVALQPGPEIQFAAKEQDSGAVIRE